MSAIWISDGAIGARNSAAETQLLVRRDGLRNPSKITNDIAYPAYTRGHR